MLARLARRGLALRLGAVLALLALLPACHTTLGPRVPAGVIPEQPEELPPTLLEPGPEPAAPAALPVESGPGPIASLPDAPPPGAVPPTPAETPARAGPPVAPVPAPPPWDPVRDRVVRKPAQGLDSARPAEQEPSASGGSSVEPPAPVAGPEPGDPPAAGPAVSDDPWLPGAAPGALPTPPTAVQPDGARAPVLDSPPGPTPGPGASAGTGGAPLPEDPWLPGAAPLGSVPDAAEAAAPARAPGAPAPADPWLPGAGTTPAAPGTQPAAQATPPAGAAVPPRSAGYSAETRELQALEHVTRLLDRPGVPTIPGYPVALLPRGDPGTALLPGPQPAVVLFVDDGSRESDLQAATSLPVLVRFADRFAFVVVDRAPGAAFSRGGEALVERYATQIPTTLVLDRERNIVLLRTQHVEAADLENALRRALGEVPAEAPAAPAPQSDPWTDPPAASQPTAAAEVPPEGAVRAPGDRDPARTDPVFSTPGGESGAPAAVAAEEARPEVAFTPPPGYGAEEHIARLRAEAGTRGLPGYPESMVRRAAARVVEQPGHRPVVLLFHDDGSKASDLQAAEFLPVVLRRQDDVDFVFIDVAPGARWSDDEKRVVRTFYNYYVPTTVVLTDRRSPVKFWYMRVTARDLDRAIEQALGRN